ncbi:hypothetical protein CRENBAI_016759 [Crenichthys baileyi]|uniref:Uncharacterized protein n=1 Tax=Crenichthys baileyi TaxID=28760 RepID=A0AAV9QTS7_9TELE
MGVEVPQQNNGVPRRGIIQHPRQGHQEGRVLCTTAWPVGRNDSQRHIPNTKAQGCDPLIHWGKPQHETAELGGNKQTHTSPPPLPVGHSRVEECPAPLKEMGSRAYAVRGGSFPPSEVTFHVPRASLSIGDRAAEVSAFVLHPNPLFTGPSRFPFQVVGPLGDCLASLVRARPGRVLATRRSPASPDPRPASRVGPRLRRTGRRHVARYIIVVMKDS